MCVGGLIWGKGLPFSEKEGAREKRVRRWDWEEKRKGAAFGMESE